MIATGRTAIPPRYFFAAVFIAVIFLSVNFLAAEQPTPPPFAATPDASQSQSASICEPSILGSPYIPVDSWVYPAMYRLYSLGYLDHIFLGMRPWTRASLSHMLENADAKIEGAEDSPETEQARQIYQALMHKLVPDTEGPCGTLKGEARIESAYSVFRGMSGTPLDDSFHLGSSIVNDYGRPFANGFNDYSGVSGYATAGRFALYVRGEFQHAPSAAGYSPRWLRRFTAPWMPSMALHNRAAPYFPRPAFRLAPSHRKTTAAFSKPTSPISS